MAKRSATRGSSSFCSSALSSSLPRTSLWSEPLPDSTSKLTFFLAAKGWTSRVRTWDSRVWSPRLMDWSRLCRVERLRCSRSARSWSRLYFRRKFPSFLMLTLCSRLSTMCAFNFFSMPSWNSASLNFWSNSCRFFSTVLWSSSTSSFIPSALVVSLASSLSKYALASTKAYSASANFFSAASLEDRRCSAPDRVFCWTALCFSDFNCVFIWLLVGSWLFGIGSSKRMLISTLPFGGERLVSLL